ncbi:hypothetical protein FACS189429_3380 [Bacteroidia bacterium]|nr:hypothetical protein FACS189429_3380 [Bacteroidia bacterium]GHV44365.1 hypothetical protein FACS1894180_5630 [Bacteroidia bacterium]
MKKTFLLILFFWATLSLSAQIQLTESNTEIFDIVRKTLYSERNYNFIGFDNNNFYFLFGNKTLFKLNAAVNEGESMELNTKVDGNVLFNFCSEDTMGLICLKKSDDELTVTQLTLNKNEGVFSSALLATLSATESSKLQFHTGESNDKTKKVALVTLISADKEYEQSYVLVFGARGELLWQTRIAPSFEKTNFTFNDVTVTNSGTDVYIVGKSYDFKQQTASNTVLQLLTIDQSGIIDQITEKCSFAEIRSLKFKVLNNNNIFIAGFYHDGNEDENNGGTFSALFNTSQNTFSLVAQTFKESLARGTKMNTAFKSDFAKKIQGIYELADSSIVVLGEDRQTLIMEKATDNALYVPHLFLAGNIFVEFYAADGTLNKFSVIYKSQSNSKVNFSATPQIAAEQTINEFRHQPLSFDVIQSDNKLLLLFNDNIKNPVHQNIPRRENLDVADLKNVGATVLYPIDGTALSRRKTLLINTKDTGRAFSEVVWTGKREALLLIQMVKGKSTFTFEKLTY